VYVSAVPTVEAHPPVCQQTLGVLNNGLSPQCRINPTSPNNIRAKVYKVTIVPKARYTNSLYY
jgi:hypothetical protein